MQPTLTSRERQLELEQALHRNKYESAIVSLKELLEVYNQRAMTALVQSTEKRGVHIGAVRALSGLLRLIEQGPTTIDSIKKGG